MTKANFSQNILHTCKYVTSSAKFKIFPNLLLKYELSLQKIIFQHAIFKKKKNANISSKIAKFVINCRNITFPMTDNF